MYIHIKLEQQDVFTQCHVYIIYTIPSLLARTLPVGIVRGAVLELLLWVRGLPTGR